MLFDLRVGNALRVRFGREARPPDPPSPGAHDAPPVIEKAVGAVPPAIATSQPIQTFISSPAAGLRPDPGGTPTSVVPADPIRYQFGWNRNAIWTPRAGEATAFSTLRNLAKLCWEIYACKETRKEQIQSMEWDIVPRDRKSRSEQSAIARVKEFWRKPDGETAFRTWLGLAIEEILVIDALSIFRRQTRGGKFYGLEIIDGATILPLLDHRGRTPVPPSVAYRQVIWGAPVTGSDCTRDELYYRPRVSTVDSPYGTSPTEAVLLAVNASIARRLFDLQYYTDGNVPEGIATLPDTWTADQIRDFEAYFNSMGAGMGPERQRIKFLPASTGDKFIRFQERDHDPKYDEFLAKIACAAFAVPPTEIGFTNDVNRATAKSQADIAQRRGVRPLSAHLKDLFDEVIAFDLGQPQLEWTWVSNETEDKLKQAQIDAIRVRNAIDSIDEIRVRDGKDPIGMGNAFVLATGPRFVSDLVHGVDDDLTTTNNRAPGTPVAASGAAARNDDAQQADGASDAEDAHADAAKSAAIDADLRKWRTVAVKAVKSGRAVKAFASDAIPPAAHAALTEALATTTTVAEVHQVFDTVAKASASATATRRLERQMRTMAQDFFRAQRDALLAHFQEPTP